MPQGGLQSLAALVRRTRLSAGLSQEELAERSGLSARTISDLERGLSLDPRPDTIRMLAEGLALTADERRSLIAAARPELRTRSGNDSTEATAQPGNLLVDLPALPGGLIGRESDVSDLVWRVTQRDGRLITLTGPGGVGKTRLALRVAHRAAPAFPGGAVFVDLAPISDPGLVASAIARTLKIPETGDRSPERALRTALAARPPMLLVLDNFEQVIEAASLVAGLSDAAPRLVMLVTSREALRVRGEDEFETQPLEVPPNGTPNDIGSVAHIPSVALFVQSARAVDQSFVLDEHAAAPVVEICRRLEGLPLAIELAATRTRHFPPDVLLRHLEPRLPLLTGGARDLPARQQTVRNTIGWSYDLLDTDEQALLRQLSVFVGGASLEAIEAVVANASDREINVLIALSSLVDKHLVRKRTGQDGSLRFSLLEVVREFAIEQLHRTQEYQRARQSHAEHFLILVEERAGTWTTHLHGSPGHELITIEIDNIRSATSWFDEHRDAESIARFVNSVWVYYYVHGLFREARALGQRALDLAAEQPLSAPLQVSAWGSLSTTMSVMGDSARALALARQSHELARQLPTEPGLLPLALIALTIALRDQYRFAEAMEYAEQALPAARVAGVDAFVEPHVLYHIGRLAYLQNDMVRAASSLGESLNQIRRLGPTETALYTINMLAAVHLKQGNLEEAASLLRDGRVLLLPSGHFGMWFDAIVLLAAKCRMPDHAARIHGFYSAYYASMGIGEAHVDPWREAEIDSLRDQVGGPHFDAEYNAGA
ncbi:MAG TPA: helix-turn-helix domain-containing protein, partial [Thermomicrobiales bacterium]|nr:helix-turn-helix domain-containing protein [Thermomicrobiales bacterium]